MKTCAAPLAPAAGRKAGGLPRGVRARSSAGGGDETGKADRVAQAPPHALVGDARARPGETFGAPEVPSGPPAAASTPATPEHQPRR